MSQSLRDFMCVNVPLYWVYPLFFFILWTKDENKILHFLHRCLFENVFQFSHSICVYCSEIVGFCISGWVCRIFLWPGLNFDIFSQEICGKITSGCQFGVNFKYFQYEHILITSHRVGILWRKTDFCTRSISYATIRWNAKLNQQAHTVRFSQ